MSVVSVRGEPAKLVMPMVVAPTRRAAAAASIVSRLSPV